MNTQTLAEKLNGCEYGNEVSKELEKEAQKHGLVIVFGSSDDLMEFRGAINDEFGVFNGGEVFVTENGILESECWEGGDCPYYQREIEKATEIKAIWCPRDKEGDIIASWVIKTNIPHDKFSVMEDGELYCRGIVFSLKDCRVNEKSKP